MIFGAPWYVWIIMFALIAIGAERWSRDRCPGPPVVNGFQDPLGILKPN